MRQIALLLVVSSRAPYHRGGLTFGFDGNRTVASVVKPLADFSDVQLMQLVADPHIVVVPLPGDRTAALAADDLGSIGGIIDRDADLFRRSAELSDREAAFASSHAQMLERAAVLETREAAVAEREEAVRRSMIAVVEPVSGIRAITVEQLADVLGREGNPTSIEGLTRIVASLNDDPLARAGLGLDTLDETDQERADRIERDGRDAINAENEEPVGSRGEPMTPRNKRRHHPPTKVPTA